MNCTDRKFVCHKCQTAFIHAHHLKSHLNRKKSCGPDQIRPNEDPIICPYCFKEFARTDNLTAHLNKQRCLFMPIASHEDNIHNHDETNSSMIASHDDNIYNHDETNSLMISPKNEIIILKKQLDEKNQLLAQLQENELKMIEQIQQQGRQQIESLKENSMTTINNNFQTFCIEQKYDAPAQQKQFDNVLEYIKECALIGDYKLGEKTHSND
jgi:hypothetical protein